MLPLAGGGVQVPHVRVAVGRARHDAVRLGGPVDAWEEVVGEVDDQ